MIIGCLDPWGTRRAQKFSTRRRATCACSLRHHLTELLPAEAVPAF